MRLIYIVREPFARMESLWLQLRRFGASSPFEDVGMRKVPAEFHVDADFNRAIRRQVEVLVDSTNYLQELDLYRTHFPDHQIHVVLFEDLTRDPVATMQRCFRFLEVDPRVELAEYGVHLNSIDGYYHARDPLWKLWSAPGLRRIYALSASRLPGRLRDELNRRILRRKVRERPVWAPETRAWAWKRIGADIELFLDRQGFSRDVWRLPAGSIRD